MTTLEEYKIINKDKFLKILSFEKWIELEQKMSIVDDIVTERNVIFVVTKFSKELNTDIIDFEKTDILEKLAAANIIKNDLFQSFMEVEISTEDFDE
jgi:hypothetical protein